MKTVSGKSIFKTSYGEVNFWLEIDPTAHNFLCIQKGKKILRLPDSVVGKYSSPAEAIEHEGIIL